LKEVAVVVTWESERDGRVKISSAVMDDILGKRNIKVVVVIKVGGGYSTVKVFPGMWWGLWSSNRVF